MTMRKHSLGIRQDGKAWIVILLLLALAGGAYYYFFMYEKEEPVSLAAPPLLPETPAPEPALEQTPDDDGEPGVTEQDVLPPAEEEDANPLPELGQSDESAMGAAAQVLGEDQARNNLVSEGLVSKIVATVDALTRDELPGNIIPVRGPGGEMQATSDGVSDEVNPETGLPEPQYVFDPVNYQRYTPQVEILEAIDVDGLMETYHGYYPLLQQSYRELGYASGEFKDRLLEVIDELLATPEPGQPIRLIKPEAFYEFADPALESLPAGQKVLIRMGPENAARVKRKLEEIRSAIQTQRE